MDSPLLLFGFDFGAITVTIPANKTMLAGMTVDGGD
jgi:hypothetical protein